MRFIAPLVCSVAALTALAADTPLTALGFTVKTHDGKNVELAKKYDGKVCLIVNVPFGTDSAGRLQALTDLHARYKERGLALLAFPSSNFTPQTESGAGEFTKACAALKGPAPDFFAEVDVRGDAQAPLFQFLTSKSTNKDFAGPIKGDYTLFLIGKDGRSAARFEPDISPGAPEVAQAIEKALAAESAADDWLNSKVGTISGTADF